MLPYLLSERAPHWSATPRGAYVGLTRAHTRGHLVRAAIEGVCQQLALVLASLRDAGNEVREIRATGGFARSPFWRQLLADALGMPVGFPAGHQGSGFGAALVGMEALGIVTSIERADELVRDRRGARARAGRRGGATPRCCPCSPTSTTRSGRRSRGCARSSATPDRPRAAPRSAARRPPGG